MASEPEKTERQTRMDCREFVKHNPIITYAHSRQIDSLIHADIPYSQESLTIQEPDLRLSIQYPEFIQHQDTILSAVEGCEKAIFNDASGAFYIGKPQISGKEGHMSILLTNGFVYMYNVLLNKVPSLSVNADVDLRILLSLVEHCPIIDGKIQIPDEELKIIQEICTKLYPKRTTDIFTPEWYSELEDFIHSLNTLIRQKYPYRLGFGGNPGNAGYQEYGLDVGLSYLRGRYFPHEGQENREQNTDKETIRFLIREAEEKGFIFNRDYRLYETHPPYTLYENQFERQNKDDLLKSVIPQLKTIFPPRALPRRGGRRTRRNHRSKKQTRRNRRR
jgi:hypothetical protein